MPQKAWSAPSRPGGASDAHRQKEQCTEYAMKKNKKVSPRSPLHAWYRRLYLST